MPSLLGIDSGLTVSKAVVFDIDGTPLATARRRVAQSMPRARHVERDMGELWRATAEAVAEAIALCGRPASDIAAVSLTAHGDGLYLLDEFNQPLGAGILSLDSRAHETLARWRRDGAVGAALALTGQAPHVSAPATLLAWIKQHEPDRYARIGAVLAAKDWLRFCLTGVLATDRTEASASFTDVHTQGYAPAALKLYGLEALAEALPPIKNPSEIVGEVTREASDATGLAAGTPVSAGLHDVTASALGIGAHEAGVLAIVAGTYSINEIVSTEPRVDPRWLCRNAIEPGLWNNMAISPASTANYDWFLDTLCRSEREAASARDASIHEIVGRELATALGRSSTLLFHPFLFGSPHGEAASASFFGLHGWHDRGDLVKAVLEGVAFNHRTHVEALRDGFPLRACRLTGGASRNPAFAQLMADALRLPVEVAEVEEPAAWGAALCAGAAVGCYSSPGQAARSLGRPAARYEAEPLRSDALERRYRVYLRLAEALEPIWPEIEALGADREVAR